MLLEFRVSNYRSFDEEQTFSFVASKDKSLEDENVHHEGDHRVLKAAAFYGANASGKTNLVSAIGVARHLICTSATEMTAGNTIPVNSFLLSRGNEHRASSFEFTVRVDGVRYDYGFSATSERITEEWLFAYPKKKAAEWLSRVYDAETGIYDWDLRGPFAKVKRALKGETRANGLALSRAIQLNVTELNPLYFWFHDKLAVIDQSTPPESQRSTMRFSLDMFKRNPQFQAYLNDLVSSADMGIVGIDVEEADGLQAGRGATMSPEERKDAEAVLKKEKWHTWSLTHRNGDSGKKTSMGLLAEAMGTRRLLALSGPWWDSLEHGFTVVADELDCSLHPHLVRKLVEAFHGSRNKSGAQLVFTTHDTSIMDLSLLRRDQIWLMEKQRSGATEMYSLYDFKDRPRNTEAISRGYLGGRYGGVPNFGPALEDVY